MHEGVRLHGFAEVVTLAFLAMERLEKIQLFEGFHPFGNDRQIEALPRLMMAPTRAASLLSRPRPRMND